MTISPGSPGSPGSPDASGGERDPEPPLDPGLPQDELVERVVDERILHRGHYLTFEVATVERADGSRSERDIVGHPGAVAIVAIDDEDRVLLVRQWRTPARKVLLEIPAGTLDPGEAEGTTEDPEVASRRELEEETGYRARTWQKLAAFWTAPGFASELMHLYLATDLEPAHPDARLGPDEDEHLRLERLPFADAVAAMERGEIADAKSIVGLLWVERLRAVWG
jgi:ADP-ribose pyrophosphatase